MIHFIIQCAVAFVATCAFAVLFHVPHAQYFYCGVTGAAGWACYLVVMALYPSQAVASFFASVVLTMMARVFAARRCCPSTLFLICGVFPLVPGAGIYYTAYYFIFGNAALAAENGSTALKMAVGIALGIVLVLALPGRRFVQFASRGKREARPAQNPQFFDNME